MENSNTFTGSLHVHHLVVGLQWLEAMAHESKWDLRRAEMLKLLGNVSDAQYVSLHIHSQDSPLDDLAQSIFERVMLLSRIAINLAALVGLENSYKLFKKPNSNPIFNGLSIMNFLIKNESIESFYTVNRYLENSIY